MYCIRQPVFIILTFSMNITLAQLNPTVGDIDGNFSRVISVVRALADETDLIVFPELFLVGYPPQDLLVRPRFIKKVEDAVSLLIDYSKDFPDTGILVGTPTRSTLKGSNRRLHNSAVLIQNGQMLSTIHKTLLPAYDVFDEPRYFDPPPEIITVPFKDQVLGISICEDYWNEPELWHQRTSYTIDPIEELVKKGATLLINLSSSPFTLGKDETRYRLIVNHAKKHHLPFVFVNQIGGNDELIFDGRSLCLNANAEIIEALPPFEEVVRTVDMNQTGPNTFFARQNDISAIHDALRLGLRDYMRKTGFINAVVGLSGGIDSAVVCALAVETLGGDNVLGITMPSEYSSDISAELAGELAGNLGISLKSIPISPVYNAYIDALRQTLPADTLDVTLENIQARIRGNILMAFSNKHGYLVLSTGNKSELATGYCTLYGDMAGGLAVISDVPKTMVYKLAEYINRESEIIPRGIIERPPSAELRPDQTDQDTLPPYDILDEILHLYIEEQKSSMEILDLGFDKETIRWVISTVDRNEYKRRQAPPGLKVTSKAFGPGRRMPMAAKY